MQNTSPPTPLLRAALSLGLGLFCAFALTLSLNHSGYEAETIGQARAILNGKVPHGRAGLLDVAIYLPFATVSEILIRLDAAPMFQEFIPNFAPALAMALTGALVFLMAAIFAAPRAALAAALAFAFTTMAWPYSKMGMESGLTLTTALAALGMFRACSDRDANVGWMIHTLGLAGILFTKTQAPLIVFLFLTCDLWLILHGIAPKPGRRTIIQCAVALIIAGVLWGVSNHFRHGGWLLSSSYSARWEMESTPGYFTRVAGLIASPGKSLFIYSPPLLAALLFAPTLCRRFRPFAAALVIVVIPQIFFHAWFRTWADETWGPRRLMNLLPILALPLALAFEKVPAQAPWAKLRRAMTLTALLLGFAFQIIAVSVNYAHVAWSLQAAGLATQRNLAWRPRTAPPLMEIKLLHSTLRRTTGAVPLVLHLPREWAARSAAEIHPWNLPEIAPDISRRAFLGLDDTGTILLIDLAPFSQSLDFWWAQRRALFPERPAWKDKPLYLLPAFVIFEGLGLAVAWRLTRARPQPSDSGQH